MEENKNVDKVFDEIKSTQETANNTAEEVKTLQSELTETKTALEASEKKAADEIALVQKQLDDAKTEFKSIAVETKKKAKGPWALAMEEVMDNKAEIIKGDKLELDIKTVNYGSGEAANVPLEDRVTDIKTDPHFMNRVRMHIGTAPSSGDTVRYNQRVSTGTGPATSDFSQAANNQADGKSHGAAFADYTSNIENKSQKIVTYGAISTVNEEQLSDVLGLQSFLMNDLMGFTMDREDTDLLGSAAGGNDVITGFRNAANGGTAWVDQRPATTPAVDNANYFDVLVNGIAQLAVQNYIAKKIFINPAAFWGTNFALAKSDQGEYVYYQMIKTGTAFIGGAQIILTPAIDADNFVIWSDGASKLHTREGLSVEFMRYGNDFANNNISVRSKLRSAHTVYLPLGIIRGTFSTALAELGAIQG